MSKVASSGRPTRDTFLEFGSPCIEPEDVDAVAACLRSGWIGTGPQVHRFERSFADYVGADHAVAVGSCTAALHLTMIAAGLGAGDEVVTTPLTFCATANAIVHVGARPVFVDIQRETMNIDPEWVERAITPRTRAIVAVHFAGRPCDMDALSEIARRRNLLLIEDAAHCIEGVYKGRKIGTIGHATCFSFYVTKNITTIEGGMVTTANPDWADAIKVHALHGLSKDAWGRHSDIGFKHYEVREAGYKYNMTDVQASLGIRQLERIDAYAARRVQLWDRYQAGLAGLPVILPAPPDADTVHARHLYTILVDLERLRCSRDEILDALRAENIGCGVHYVGLHLQDYYRRTYSLGPEDYPNATFVSNRTISLPFSPRLTDEDADSVVAGVRKVLRSAQH